MSDRLDSTGLAHYTEEIIKKVGCIAVDTGTISSLPKVINDARIDGQYVVKNIRVFKDLDLGWVTTDGKLVLYGTMDPGVSYPSVQLWLQRVDALDEDEIGCTVAFHTGSSSYKNYLQGTTEHLIPGTVYSVKLYKCGDGGNDTQMASSSYTATKPDPKFTWYQTTYSLTSGWYYMTISAGNTLLATSSAVEFTAAA